MGSDTPSSSALSATRSFNSRSRMGSDLKPVRRSEIDIQFQFTLPHGERPAYANIVVACGRFNSRSRMGSDR